MYEHIALRNEMVLDAYPFARRFTSTGEYLTGKSSDAEVEEFVKPTKQLVHELYNDGDAFYIENKELFTEEEIRDVLFELRDLLREYDTEFAFDIMLGRRNTDLELIEE